MNRMTNRPALSHRVLTILALFLPFLLAASAISAAHADPTPTPTPMAPAEQGSTGLTMTISGPPLTPPARICGDAAVLAGPTSPAPGAVVVNVGDNVDELTGASPAGTTFWLAPGVHQFRYSVVPKDGDTYIGAPGAIVDGGGTIGTAFWEEFYGRKAKNVTLSHLTVQNFTSSGEDQGSIYAGVGWKIVNSTLKNNGYVALFAGPDNIIQNNCFDSNGQLAIATYRFDDNTYNVTVDHNEITKNNTKNLQDCGCGGGMKWWTMNRGQFTNNWVHNNKGAGVWADDNNIEMLFEGNYIDDNDGEGIFYEVSYNFMIRNNTIIRNALSEGAALNGNFPVGGVYISESGGVHVPGYQYEVSEIYNNYFQDNWDGVVLWESGNRYKGTDGPGYGPKFGDQTHWKTQNVLVHDNEFHMNKSNAGCSGNPNCGRNALFSDWVPVPGAPESPNRLNNQYQTAVTFNQNNIFRNNKYFGPWNFVAYDQSLLYSWATWVNAKPVPSSSFNYWSPGSSGFGQDAGSSIDSADTGGSPGPVVVGSPSPGPVSSPGPVVVGSPSPGPVSSPGPVVVGSPSPGPVSSPGPVVVGSPSPGPVSSPGPVVVGSPSPEPVSSPGPSGAGDSSYSWSTRRFFRTFYRYWWLWWI